MSIVTKGEQVARAGSAFLSIQTLNASGTAETPSAAVYTLMDDGGSVINSKSRETITPAETMEITLSGDDLDPDVGRVVWVYVEATVGGRPYNGSLKLDIVSPFPYNNELGL